VAVKRHEVWRSSWTWIEQEPTSGRAGAARLTAGRVHIINSDANAVAHGKQVCRQLEDGGQQQGMPADQVGMQYYCPQFSEGFHVLETITVTGSFTLKDESPNVYAPPITVSGSSCSGSGGYSDIDQGTQVTVKTARAISWLRLFWRRVTVAASYAPSDSLSTSPRVRTVTSCR
jgi:hypothetical protein